jgi:trk system potassium uptake protein TrkH
MQNRYPSRPAWSLSRHLTPARIFILSFAGLVLAGAFLLWLPFASTEGLRFVDALFISASAVCVTGLTTVEVGTELSTAGQAILICLFQVGGLGILTFSAFLFGIMGRGISFKGREIVQSTFLHTPQRDFFFILKSVILTTLIIESAGVLLLFIRFSQDFPLSKALYYSVFHAVSAFNNCGFSLFPDSFTRYQGDLLLNVTVMMLITLGGIGFVVHHEVIARLRDRNARLSLHCRIVLITTACLIVSGAVLFWLFEEHYILRGLSPQTQVLVSIFQSITPRTAGFNTVDIGQLTNATILLLLVLMFIGGSPGSTAGGIKTTSFALLLLMIWNRWRGSDEVTVFNRTVPKELIGRTLSITFASMISVFFIVAAVMVAGHVESGPQGRQLFAEYIFEAVSAFGTVGLSMGVTAKLTDIQKLLIVFMMFAGRVGPLTLAFSLSFREGKKRVVYAEETVMVG